MGFFSSGAAKPPPASNSAKWSWKGRNAPDPIDAGRWESLKAALGGGASKLDVEACGEETQALLGRASEKLWNVAEQAGSKIGGRAGATLQAVTVSRERWTAFFIMVSIGCAMLLVSYLTLPLIVIAPQKFAGSFTAGSFCIFASLGILKGPWSLLEHLVSRERALLSVCYFGSMAGTLYASLWLQSMPLTLVASGLQISQLLWFLVAYIPGGQLALGYLQGSLCSGLSRLCCGFCWSA
eukprot:TRINITY_DN123952_c0_g1_i1.p1 TRINITY_DN123952_c0_g1~~TRINITY_DN123952_c0_g1_i1.p1  ORF type:complete len:239 (+),score=41.30 TRINITY_DN123952_c0_g1_i1:70-786(+)